jgi:hypothetical protein
VREKNIGPGLSRQAAVESLLIWRVLPEKTGSSCHGVIRLFCSLLAMLTIKLTISSAIELASQIFTA